MTMPMMTPNSPVDDEPPSSGEPTQQQQCFTRGEARGKAAERTEGRAEDFNDEDLHEQRGVLSIGQGARTARDTDAYTTRRQ